MKILRTIYILCAAALLCSSCQDEEMIKQSGVKEGIPVTIDLTFSAVVPKQETVGTRAERNPENNVNDLYVLIFNRRTGALKGGVHFFSGEDFINNQSYPTEETLEGTIDISTISGESVIYAIANAQESPSEYNLGGDTSIQSVKDIDDLQQICVELRRRNSTALNRIGETRYLMSGCLSCNIGTDGSITPVEENEDAKVKLYRTDSRINFTIQAGEGSNCDNFTLLSYQVCKIPSKTSLVALKDANGNQINYDNETELSDNYWDTESGLQPLEGNTLSFYVPENIKMAKNSNCTRYAEREAWEKGANDERVFTNAPDNGTYVILHGLFEGKVTESTHVSSGTEARASVDYIIHLGDWTNNSFGTFSNVRNVEYNYIITVNGVNNIIVEVETSNDGQDGVTENEPGAEGDVFFQDGIFYDVDAHNEALLMKFTLDEITAVGTLDNFFRWRINSPFEEREANVDWLQFRLNEKNNNIYCTDRLRPYPGDSSAELMNLNELMEALKDIRTNKKDSKYADENGDLVVTCFVKEYVYDESVHNWGEYTNQTNREAYIFGEILDSEDGNSSTIHTKYVISQRAIQTPDSYYSGIGFGIETINETGDLPMGNVGLNNRPADEEKGLDNTLAMLGSLTQINSAAWGYLDANNYSAPNDYQYAAYACLLRNRDENGNGTIDDSEIKWYLPAIDQYSAIYAGTDALSISSRLYTENAWTIKHYFTSTWEENQYNIVAPWIIWSEEGFATQIFRGGDAVDESDVEDETDENVLLGERRRTYRCMRNLGEGDREPYYSHNGNIIEFPHMKERAYRGQVINDVLSSHNQTEEQNRLYRKFQYAENYIQNDEGRNVSYTAAAVRRNDPCVRYSEDGYPAGTWRMPNHRELMLMLTAGLFDSLSDGAHVHCRTSFNFYGKENPRRDGQTKQAYMVQITDQGAIMQIPDVRGLTGTDDTEGFVRCVRDVVE